MIACQVIAENSVLRLLGDSLGQAPSEFAWALNALDLYLATPRELAVMAGAVATVWRASKQTVD